MLGSLGFWMLSLEVPPAVHSRRPGGGAAKERLQFSRGRMEMSGRADCIPSAPGEMEAILTPASADRETNTILIVRWMISILHVQHLSLFLFGATMGTFIAISSEMIRDVQTSES